MTERFFKFADLGADGLDGHVEALCGAGETAFFFAADFFLATGAGVGCFWMTSTGGS
jgi:hypothetical protein